MNPDPMPFPKEFLECLQAWRAIRTQLQPLEPTAVDYIDGKMDSAAWAWDPVNHPRKTLSQPDSTVPVSPSLASLGSSGGDAPPLAGGAGQAPMLPVQLQLNLAEAARRGKVALGDGLLQMFVAIDDPQGQAPQFRVIPAKDVAAEKLTPVPAFEDVAMPFVVSIDWACREFDPDESDTHGLQITGYEEPRFVLQRMDPLAEVVDLAGLDNPDLKSAIKDFDALIKKWKSIWRPNGFHLFGTFESIQYNAAEKTETTLLFGKGAREEHGSVVVHRRCSCTSVRVFDLLV